MIGWNVESELELADYIIWALIIASLFGLWKIGELVYWIFNLIAL